MDAYTRQQAIQRCAELRRQLRALLTVAMTDSLTEALEAVDQAEEALDELEVLLGLVREDGTSLYEPSWEAQRAARAAEKGNAREET